MAQMDRAFRTSLSSLYSRFVLPALLLEPLLCRDTTNQPLFHRAAPLCESSEGSDSWPII